MSGQLRSPADITTLFRAASPSSLGGRGHRVGSGSGVVPAVVGTPHSPSLRPPYPGAPRLVRRDSRVSGMQASGGRGGGDWLFGVRCVRRLLGCVERACPPRPVLRKLSNMVACLRASVLRAPRGARDGMREVDGIGAYCNNIHTNRHYH